MAVEQPEDVEVDGDGDQGVEDDSCCGVVNGSRLAGEGRHHGQELRHDLGHVLAELVLVPRQQADRRID